MKRFVLIFVLLLMATTVMGQADTIGFINISGLIAGQWYGDQTKVDTSAATLYTAVSGDVVSEYGCYSRSTLGTGTIKGVIYEDTTAATQGAINAPLEHLSDAISFSTNSDSWQTVSASHALTAGSVYFVGLTSETGDPGIVDNRVVPGGNPGAADPDDGTAPDPLTAQNSSGNLQLCYAAVTNGVGDEPLRQRRRQIISGGL